MNAIDNAAATTEEQTTLLITVEQLTAEFERLLASESHLLKSGQADGLEAIAEAKREIIQQISELESTLIPLFEERPQREEIIELIDRLRQCRVDSRNNHDLVMLELRHTNRSLELLRSVLNMDDLALYSELGKVRISREKRRLGSA